MEKKYKIACCHMKLLRFVKNTLEQQMFLKDFSYQNEQH